MNDDNLLIRQYISLPGGTVRPPQDLAELYAWHEGRFKPFVEGGVIVRKDKLPDGVEVSTVFLGHDHNFGEDGPPILFETMVFGGPNDGHQEHYATLAEALDGHQSVLAAVKAGRSLWET